MRREQALADFVQNLASIDDEKDVHRVVARIVREHLGADGATFVVREGDRCHHVEEDAIGPLWRGRSFPMSGCISGWAMQHRRPGVVRDVLQDERIPEGVYEPTFVRSLIMAPILAEEPLGALGAYWAAPRESTREEVLLLETIATATALAVRNARLVGELRTREARLSAVFDNALQAFLLLDNDLRVVASNPVADLYARQFFGRSFREGDDAHALFNAIDEDKKFERRARRALAGEAFTVVTSTSLPDGRQLSFELCYTPVRAEDRQIRGLALSVLDITERRQLEEQLLAAQRVESIGRLTQGIAHDLNNLLTPILCSTQLLRAAGRAGVEAEADLGAIEEAARRGAELTRHLLAFSRSQVLEVRRIELNREIENTLRFLHRATPDDVVVRAELAPELPAIHADAARLIQVLVNLVINAAEAMPAGGTVEIGTALADPDGDGRPRVRLWVSDDGPGMDADTRERIFEPFFTTKGDTGGSGLGLATSYGTVTQHGGTIDVHSEAGKGTTFTVVLPVGRAPREGAVERPLPSAARSGSETILVVDDEPHVLSVMERILREYDYDVLSASSPERALRYMAERAEIDLVVSDVIMPTMDGRELADRMGIPVLYVSGYPRDVIAERGILRPGVHFLPKPFTPEALIGAVRHVLDGREPGRIET